MRSTSVQVHTLVRRMNSGVVHTFFSIDHGLPQIPRKTVHRGKSQRTVHLASACPVRVLVFVWLPGAGTGCVMHKQAKYTSPGGGGCSALEFLSLGCGCFGRPGLFASSRLAVCGFRGYWISKERVKFSFDSGLIGSGDPGHYCTVDPHLRVIPLLENGERSLAPAPATCWPGGTSLPKGPSSCLGASFGGDGSTVSITTV